ncbi:MAG: peptidoglycan-binding protein, partial [Gemmataceae bacterium]
HDFYHFYDSTTGKTSVKVTGGPYAAHGLWQGGATNIFAGASAGNYIGYSVSNGGHLGVRWIWNDAGGGTEAEIASVTGTSTFSYEGAAVYQPTCAAGPAIDFDDFHGTAALVNLNMSCTVDISGDGSNGNVLGVGLVSGVAAPFFTNDSTPAASSTFLNGQTTASPPSGTGSSEVAEQGTADASFLTTTLNQLRTELPTELSPLASGVTDARFYRIWVNSALTGIHIEAAPVTTPPTFSAISASATTTEATISWTTDEDADSQVEYRTSTAYTASTTYDAAYVTSHSAPLSSLSACTTYHYAVLATDVYGNHATSTDETLKTTGCASSSPRNPGSGNDNGSSTPSTPTPNGSSGSSNGFVPASSGPPPSIFNMSATATPATSTPSAATSSPSVAAAPYPFNRSLHQGMTGPDVLALQEYLNAHGAPLGSTGPGSSGNETDYFGVLTKAAVIIFQDAHAEEILYPLDLKYGTGYFGPSTSAFIDGQEMP